MQMNIKITQNTVKLGSYCDKPVLGSCLDIYNKQKVCVLMQKQCRLLESIDSFIESNDRYNLSRDKELIGLVKQMLSKEWHQRPTLDQVIQYTKTYSS